MKLALPALLALLAPIAHAQPGEGLQPRKRPPPPTVKVGMPVVTGPLDKEIVRRYLKRNLGRFTYCYEKQLLVEANLKGTLKAAYTITPEGKVTAAGTMGVEGEVAACTKRVLELIEYPKPLGGKEVAVKVDFTLTP